MISAWIANSECRLPSPARTAPVSSMRTASPGSTSSQPHPAAFIHEAAADLAPCQISVMISGMDVIDPTERIAFVIRMVSGALTQEIEQALRPVRLTQVQLAALVQLSRGGDLSATELARRSGVTPQSMASALGGLQKRALVVRAPHPTHGRVVQFSVTEDGRSLAAQGQQMVAGVNAKAMALVDPGERQRLHGLLLTLAGGLGLPVEHEQLKANKRMHARLSK
jgi:DNA-binding MarR family transcriptional regulator